MESDMFTFAHQSPDASGCPWSDNEREQQIRAFVQSVDWIHPGALLTSSFSNPNGIEAVLVLRRPPLPKELQPSRLERFWSWLSERMPEMFTTFSDHSRREYEWQAFKIRRKNLLVLHEAVKDAETMKKQGFDLQIVLPKVEKLHRIALPNPAGIICPTEKPFDDFLRIQCRLARLSLGR
jgi:hypothetical protein